MNITANIPWIIGLSLLSLTACSPDEDLNDQTSITGQETSIDSDFSVLYDQFSEEVEVYQDGDQVVFRTENIPNHPSPYFGQGDSRYEAPHAGMVVNPNSITEQNYVLRMPLEPSFANQPSETGLDAIGVTVNGVVMFNQYAGRDATGFIPLDREIESFDAYNGHPAPQDNYHYHMEPHYLTAEDPSALVGFILDGFPIYGPEEPDGSTPTDLDECNGHIGPTPEFPEGIYHYHVTSEAPYLCGCYKGAPGSRSN